MSRIFFPVSIVSSDPYWPSLAPVAVTGAVAAGNLSFDALLYAGAASEYVPQAAYQFAIRYPGAISATQQAITAFTTPGGIPTNGPEYAGAVGSVLVNYVTNDTFGP